MTKQDKRIEKILAIGMTYVVGASFYQIITVLILTSGL